MLSITALLTSVENLLIKNNTSTSSWYISNGLNEKVRSFYKGNDGFSENKPIAKTQYPAICVELKSKNEEMKIISREKRDATIRMTIVCITNYISGLTDTKENSDMESIAFSQNVEYLIRNNVTLSATVHMMQIESTEYGVDIREDYYNAVSRIHLLINMYNI